MPRWTKAISSNDWLCARQSRQLSGDTPVFGDVGRPLPQHHQTFGLTERKRPHQRRVGQPEDGAVDANAERERQRGDEREPGSRGELPQRQPHVDEQVFHGDGLTERHGSKLPDTDHRGRGLPNNFF